MVLGFAVAAGHPGELERAGGSLKELRDAIHDGGFGGLGWDQWQRLSLRGFGGEDAMQPEGWGLVGGVAWGGHRGGGKKLKS